ncbi:MAG: type II secretion system protein [Phycisphaerales bacterium]|nr:MAG: type II secretion system protein [Phycisphaerales bacterium]
MIGVLTMKRKGFTLIELLVVIAIIALLMAILMPTLARAKKQAKDVICRANLKHWGLVWSMYTGDHDGYFHRGWIGGATGPADTWPNAVRSYVGIGTDSNDVDFYCCPEATKPIDQGKRLDGGVHLAWSFGGVFNHRIGDYGSYGINSWVCNPPRGYGSGENWRTPSVKGAGYVPLFLDSAWYNAKPHHTDNPPFAEDGFFHVVGSTVGMFCLNRHSGAVNGLFLDWSVRKIGLKELWKLTWHKGYPTDADPPVWPDWMKGFKDY